ADGILITPSHNPPRDGGFKYNPPSGGPADVEITRWVQDRANALLGEGARNIKRLPYNAALTADTTKPFDFVALYVGNLAQVVDMDAIRGSRIRIGVDPLGGATVGYWGAVAERFGLDLTVTNAQVDPTFRFVPVDHD